MSAFQYSSCGCIPSHDPSRRRLFAVTKNKWFDRFILLTIFVSCIQLGMESSELAARSMAGEMSAQITEDVLYIANIVITVIFTAEAVIKIAALGFIQHPGR